MNRREIKKKRIAFKIWTVFPRVEKYKIGAAVQILETFRFILFRDDSFTRGQPPISVTGHWRSLSYVFFFNLYFWYCVYSIEIECIEILYTTPQLKMKCLKSFIDRKSFPASIITIIDKSTYSFLAAETFHRLTGRVSTNFAHMRMLWKRICTIGRSWKLDWLPFKGTVNLKSPLIQTKIWRYSVKFLGAHTWSHPYFAGFCT